MKFVYSTGQRELYFEKARVGDCVCRAIVNATGLDYLEVYNGINAEAKNEHDSKRKRRRSSARNGVYTGTAKRYIERTLGWVWVPCMTIGSGCQVHLTESELPAKGKFIINLSKHFTCVKDGVLYDTYDCSRNGTRCVYGYWREPTEQEKEWFADTKKMVAEYEQKKEQERQEIKKKQKIAKEHNKRIIKKYAKRINKLASQLRKLERERDAQLVEVPKLRV